MFSLVYILIDLPTYPALYSVYIIMYINALFIKVILRIEENFVKAFVSFC